MINCHAFSSIELFDENNVIDYNENIILNRGVPFNADYVLKKYEHEIDGKTFVYYPAKSPKRLIISFGYAAPFKAYGMWSWFWKDDEDWDDTAYLFLSDGYNWFLGTHDKPVFNTYINLIKHFIELCKLKPENVYTVGASAGGYAAILFGCTLGLRGAIADVPNYDPETWNASIGWQMIKPEIAWKDLSKVILESPKIPFISIHHGDWSADVVAAHKIIDALKQRQAFYSVRRTVLKYHTAFTVNKEFVEREIEHMETQEDLEQRVIAQQLALYH